MSKWLAACFLAVFVTVWPFPGAAQTEATPTPEPAGSGSGASAGQAIVQAGAYILRLSNVSPRDGTFDVDMWVWFRWKNADFNPIDTFELANGVISNREVNAPEMDGDMNYSTARVQATIYHDFDVRRFPLDDHVITLDFEDASYDESSLKYAPDSGTALDPGVTVAGWQVGLGAPEVVAHVYNTDYGLHESGETAGTYSRLIVPITLERTSYGVLFKSFWISLLSVVLGLLAFMVKADDLDARFGMGVGSIFAASANSFVIADTLPQTTVVTLAEQINLIAVGVIFLSVFISIWSLRLRYKEMEVASLRLDRQAMIILGLAYVGLTILVMNVDLA